MDEAKFDIYANNFHCTVGIYDFTLDFNTVLPVGQMQAGQAPTLEKSATAIVRMSPSHAKAVAVIFLRNVLAYESQFGPLPLAPEQQAIWDDCMERLTPK